MKRLAWVVAVGALALAAWFAGARSVESSRSASVQNAEPLPSKSSEVVAVAVDRVLARGPRVDAPVAAEAPGLTDTYSTLEWQALPRHDERWLFFRIAAKPRELCGADLVRSEPLNPRDVRLGPTDAERLDQRLKPLLGRLDELLGIRGTIRHQEAHDLVAAGIIQPVETATDENLMPDEQTERRRLVELYRARWEEEPTLSRIWKSAEDMALAKLTENRAGGSALRTGDKWYAVPPERLARTREMEGAIRLARESLLAEMCAWAVNRQLTQSQDTACTTKGFAEFCEKHLKR